MSTSQLSAQEAFNPTRVFVHVGNGVAYNKTGLGLGVGLGVDRDFTSRWGVRADAEFTTAKYHTEGYELDILNRVSVKPLTRSYAISATLFRHFTLGKSSSQRLSVGVGLLGRYLTMRTVTYAVIPEETRFDGSTPFTGVIDKFKRDFVNVAPVLDYQIQLNPRLSLGAYVRYELQFIDSQENYLRVVRVNPEGAETGFSNYFTDFLDGPRAVSLGLTAGYSLFGS